MKCIGGLPRSKRQSDGNGKGSQECRYAVRMWDMSENLYSFDVFDTLIARRTATPEGIFALMQQKLTEQEHVCWYPERIVRNFYLLRIEAEKVARNTYITEEVKDITLRQIYECFLRMEDLSEVQVQELMALEVAVESENILPIPENIEKVRILKEAGERVVLISNMYLGQEVIHNLLLQASPIFEDIPLYVSGELGKTKGTLTLYHHVKGQEQVEFSGWCHYGDNQNLDVDIPRSLGIQAKHCTRQGLLDWEKDLLRGKENDSELQLLLGISQRTRGQQKGSAGFPYQVGCGFSAEILVPYVSWVLWQSRKLGVKKLCFIARDGYILKKVADMLIAGYRLQTETAYLYGSRKAWRLPSIRSDRFDMEEFLRWNYPGEIRTFTQIAEILGLTIEELKAFLPFAHEDPEELAGSLVWDVLQMLLEEQGRVAEAIHEKQREARKAAQKYLLQELGDRKDIAFVDLIGSGYTQKCLADLMEGFHDAPIRTFFYRLDYCRCGERNRNYAYFPNQVKMGNIIEVLCGAPHGQTNGYERKGEAWVPILGNDEGAKLKEYGFDDYVSGIEDYVKELISCFPEGMPVFRNLEIPAAYFTCLAQARNRELYDYIAKMPYGITGKEKEVASFAPQLSLRDLRNLYLWHKGEPERKYYKGHSLEYSLICLSDKQKRKLELYKKHSEDMAVRWLRQHFFQSKAKVCTSRYDLIAERIVLYGAGKKGRLLHRQLAAGKQYHAEIVLWVDRNYEDCQAEGLQVYPPEDMAGTDYRQVVIAVANRQMAEEIKGSLIARGVRPGKILWIQPDSRIC